MFLFLLQDSGSASNFLAGGIVLTLLIAAIAIGLIVFILLYIIRSFKAFSAVLEMKKELQAIHRTLLEQSETIH
jgi:hypothetical protein